MPNWSAKSACHSSDDGCINVEGHKGCIVWGSDDQGAPYYAELVVPFSRPVEIKGDRYSLLTLYADKKHILDIIKTLKFLPH